MKKFSKEAFKAGLVAASLSGAPMETHAQTVNEAGPPVCSTEGETVRPGEDTSSNSRTIQEWIAWYYDPARTRPEMVGYRETIEPSLVETCEVSDVDEALRQVTASESRSSGAGESRVGALHSLRNKIIMAHDPGVQDVHRRAAPALESGDEALIEEFRYELDVAMGEALMRHTTDEAERELIRNRMLRSQETLRELRQEHRRERSDDSI